MRQCMHARRREAFVDDAVSKRKHHSVNIEKYKAATVDSRRSTRSAVLLCAGRSPPFRVLRHRGKAEHKCASSLGPISTLKTLG
eukprot:2288335-Pleurochrysis_carterae.AAC.2